MVMPGIISGSVILEKRCQPLAPSTSAASISSTGMVFSVATILGQRAIFSLDYELNNYKSAKFSDNEGTKIIENPNKVKKLKTERIAVEQKETA